MTEGLGHKILSSIKEYFNYRLIKDYAAFRNISTNLYSYSDKKVNNATYGSPYAQWIYQSGLSGVQVPSSVSGINRGVSGMAIDFINGRFLFNSGITGLSLGTVNISVPDVNTYISTSSESQLINQTNFLVAPILTPATTYLPPYNYIASALFFRIQMTENEEMALGGLDKTKWRIRVTAVMKNDYHLAAVGEIVRDMNGRIFPIISNPLNEANDLKDPSWDYLDILENPTQYASIDDSSFKFYEADPFTQKNPSLFIGIGMLEITLPRYPGSEFP